MLLPSKPAPSFDRSFLIELGGGTVFREAEKLFESHYVESAEWESPVLKGLVNGGDGIYTPELNLRSTVFAENTCTCANGRKRKVCVHALATALHYEALRNEAAHRPTIGEVLPPKSEPASKPEKPKVPRVSSIKIGEDGLPLRLLIFLPPNLPEAADRGGIVLKFDVATGREILPLNKLNPRQKYKVASKQVAVLKLIESWCGGKLASLVQLTSAQVRKLLDVVAGEPIVYWVKKPNAPIDWHDGQLPGVYEYLSELESNHETPEPEPVALGLSPAKRLDTNPSKQQIRADINLRAKAKPNLRAIAEAKGPKLWETKKGDYPIASEAAASMEGHSTSRVVVDGSTHYIAIRLPSGENANVQALRTILKSEGFLLEPSNRKWWLRDRHKTLNFLAAHWKALKDEWEAEFTDNFKAKLKEVEISALQIEAKEDAGKFALAITLSEQTNETDLRRALASSKNYVETNRGGITLLDRNSIEQLHEIERAVSGQADRPFTPTFTKRLDTRELSDVEDLLDELCEGWQPPQAWQSRSRALKEVGALEPAPVRPGFDSILRTYQRIGTAWLWHLYRHKLGGILADEMGLGKTLQALALIECIRNQDSHLTGTGREQYPGLVVCPASLVENWQRESARFTPKLKTLKHHGSKRAKELSVLEEYDTVITSYGTLRQDAEMLGLMDWCVVIGDEAQHIKNCRSQNAKTLMSLHAGGLFLLTGTPVENSLDDLFSLFSVLMPGYRDKPTGELS